MKETKELAYLGKFGLCLRRRRSILLVRHGGCDAGQVAVAVAQSHAEGAA